MNIQPRHADRASRNLPAVIRAARNTGSPTTGNLARLIWTLASSPSYLSGRDAAKLYIQCGYKPFSGYPLTRA